MFNVNGQDVTKQVGIILLYVFYVLIPVCYGENSKKHNRKTQRKSLFIANRDLILKIKQSKYNCLSSNNVVN